MAAPTEPTWYNCTPHDIHIYNQEGTTVVLTIPRSDWNIRVQTSTPTPVGTWQGVPLVSQQQPTGFSAEDHAKLQQASRKKHTLIVSFFVATVVKDVMPDYGGMILGPNSGPQSVVRDAQGRILGVRTLECYLDGTKARKRKTPDTMTQAEAAEVVRRRRDDRIHFWLEQDGYNDICAEMLKLIDACIQFLDDKGCNKLRRL